MREFEEYTWPGNVRELRNIIERNLILNSGPIFHAELSNSPQGKNISLRRLDEVNTEYFRKVLQSTHWRVRGQGGAAEVLGLKPTTLEARVKKAMHWPARIVPPKAWRNSKVSSPETAPVPQPIILCLRKRICLLVVS
jgi:DNA-binding NtrC family response regulator